MFPRTVWLVSLIFLSGCASFASNLENIISPLPSFVDESGHPIVTEANVDSIAFIGDVLYYPDPKTRVVITIDTKTGLRDAIDLRFFSANRILSARNHIYFIGKPANVSSKQREFVPIAVMPINRKEEIEFALADTNKAFDFAVFGPRGEPDDRVYKLLPNRNSVSDVKVSKLGIDFVESDKLILAGEDSRVLSFISLHYEKFIELPLSEGWKENFQSIVGSDAYLSTEKIVLAGSSPSDLWFSQDSSSVFVAYRDDNYLSIVSSNSLNERRVEIPINRGKALSASFLELNHPETDGFLATFDEVSSKVSLFGIGNTCEDSEVCYHDNQRIKGDGNSNIIIESTYLGEKIFIATSNPPLVSSFSTNWYRYLNEISATTENTYKFTNPILAVVSDFSGECVAVVLRGGKYSVICD